MSGSLTIFHIFSHRELLIFTTEIVFTVDEPTWSPQLKIFVMFDCCDLVASTTICNLLRLAVIFGINVYNVSTFLLPACMKNSWDKIYEIKVLRIFSNIFLFKIRYTFNCKLILGDPGAAC